MIAEHQSFTMDDAKGPQPIISALKGNFGHCVTGAGAVESAMAFMTFQEGIIPKIRNLVTPLSIKNTELSGLNFAKHNIKKDVKVIVKNSLVFGGINTCLIFKKADEAELRKAKL